jgi:hypothetical protein
MDWHKLLMKHGLGSPGYIAKKMAKTYRIGKENYPEMEEREVLRRLLLQRVLAQSMLSGPVQYQFLKQNPAVLEELVHQQPDLFSIITLAIFIEHPELLRPGAPVDAFDALTETVQEVLDTEAPGWRTEGVWRDHTVVCSLCQTKIEQPDPALMTATTYENGTIEYLCAEHAPPFQMRAMCALGFFMGHMRK